MALIPIRRLHITAVAAINQKFRPPKRATRNDIITTPSPILRQPQSTQTTHPQPAAIMDMYAPNNPQTARDHQEEMNC